MGDQLMADKTPADGDARDSYTLKFPYAGTGRRIERLTFKSFTMDDVDAFNAIDDPYKRAKEMVRVSADLAPEELQKMDPRDFREIQDIVAGFL